MQPKPRRKLRHLLRREPGGAGRGAEECFGRCEELHRLRRIDVPHHQTGHPEVSEEGSFECHEILDLEPRHLLEPFLVCEERRLEDAVGRQHGVRVRLLELPVSVVRLCPLLSHSEDVSVNLNRRDRFQHVLQERVHLAAPAVEHEAQAGHRRLERVVRDLDPEAGFPSHVAHFIEAQIDILQQQPQERRTLYIRVNQRAVELQVDRHPRRLKRRVLQMPPLNRLARHYLLRDQTPPDIRGIPPLSSLSRLRPRGGQHRADVSRGVLVRGRERHRRCRLVP
mmetsp:Transcript_63088/g.150544  ORF Transcript_63088/g.150544 Transcript_63088/m.150544 type:complete len:281 (-) Transcript_63088:124-966(-)